MSPAISKHLRHSITYLIAGILLHLLCADVNAYRINYTSTNKEIKWFALNVPYSINTAEGPDGSLTAIQASMQTWTDVPGSALNFFFDGKTPSTAWGENDGTNIVCFGVIDESSVLAKTLQWYYVDTGESIDSDIKFNTRYSWSTGGSPDDFDVQNVGTHEFGHSAGLADLYAAADAEKTMYGYSSEGETKQRTLDQDDINGIRYLYGNGSITTSTTTTTVATTTSITITSTIPVPTTIVTTTAPAVFTTTTIPSREAEFAGAPTSGYLPLEVTFTNVSAGDIKYCFWDFGDGSGISLDFSPIHNYRKPGKFTVTLVVVFSDGTKQEVVKQDYISVLVPCAFATSLHNQDDIELVRNLRDSYINNISWLDLFALYYKHTAEVTALLREHSELQHALIKQVTDNKQAIQELIMWRRTTLRMDALDEIAGFFLRLRDYGSTSLQDDIDLMLQGIEDRHLLHKLGVSVSY